MRFCFFTVSMALAALVLPCGCSSFRSPNRVARLSDIPDYRPPAGKMDCSAKLCVYRRISFFLPNGQTWYADEPIESALRRAGFAIVTQEPLLVGTLDFVESPDLVIEPLHVWQNLEQCQSETWLYTKVVVSVRPPVEDPAALPPYRIFQSVARRNLGRKAPNAISLVSPDVKRSGIAAAVENLLCVDSFRDALRKPR